MLKNSVFQRTKSVSFHIDNQFFINKASFYFYNIFEEFNRFSNETR